MLIGRNGKTQILKFALMRAFTMSSLTNSSFSTSNSSKPQRKALYPGSFDPPSSGHLDIIKRALTICDTLVVGIGHNPMKKPMFTYEERKNLLKKITKEHGDRVQIEKIEGLLADFI